MKIHFVYQTHPKRKGRKPPSLREKGDRVRAVIIIEPIFIALPAC